MDVWPKNLPRALLRSSALLSDLVDGLPAVVRASSTEGLDDRQRPPIIPLSISEKEKRETLDLVEQATQPAITHRRREKKVGPYCVATEQRFVRGGRNYRSHAPRVQFCTGEQKLQAMKEGVGQSPEEKTE